MCGERMDGTIGMVKEYQEDTMKTFLGLVADISKGVGESG